MNQKITMPALISLLAEASGHTKKQCEDFLRELFATIAESLEAGENVKIKGIGTFKLILVEARKSVNINTGEEIKIPAHKKISFVPAKELAELINSPFSIFETVEIDNTESIAIEKKDDDDENIEDILEDEETIAEELTKMRSSTEDDIDTIETGISNSTKTAETNFIDNVIETNDISRCNTESANPSSLNNAITNDLDIQNINNNITSETKSIEQNSSSINSNPAMIDEEQLLKIFEKFYGHKIAEKNNSGTPDPKFEETSNSQTSDTSAISDNESISDSDNDLISDSENVERINSEALIEDNEDYEYHNNKKNAWKFFWGFICGIIFTAIISLVAYITYTDTWSEYLNFNFLHKSTSSPLPDTIVDTINESKNDSIDSIASLVPQTDSIKVQNIEKDNDKPKESDIVYDTVSETRYLTTMAKAHYGNYNLWPIIYKANEKKLGHPDRIRPGTKVRIPKLSEFGINPANKEDINKIKRMGGEIYAKYRTQNSDK